MSVTVNVPDTPEIVTSKLSPFEIPSSQRRARYFVPRVDPKSRSIDALSEPATQPEAGYIPERINAGFTYVFSEDQLPMGENLTMTAQYNDLMGHMDIVDRGTIKVRPQNIEAR